VTFITLTFCENDQVFVRIRPESSNVRTARSTVIDRKAATVTSRLSVSPKRCLSQDGGVPAKCVSLVDETTIRIIPPDGALGTRKSVSAIDDKIFTFDKVFAEESSQEDIYQSISAHVKATVRGYNTTIFAYGSTGSGKSYTMTGNSSAPGIIPRAISEVFSIIEATAAQESDVFFYVRLSYVELYNNNFRNLLEFASKELSVKEKGKTSEEDENNLRPDSPSKLHPGLVQRTDKIEVRESQSAGVFLAGPSLRIPVSYLCCYAMRCRTVQYSTVQYSTVQYSTVQYSTIWSL
jgi:Kinesin motor domain